eukprot:TRINITY_DN76283_c0_g1_i1.p1 TRINITY_DN76283_c0_g1~~TRINITY_DN76283_c0_g1_i1.p1  ORF type:complete len:407 (-),score=40.68 TRINITY_DN76283_c0_g1_i1:94-1314(-)
MQGEASEMSAMAAVEGVEWREVGENDKEHVTSELHLLVSTADDCTTPIQHLRPLGRCLVNSVCRSANTQAVDTDDVKVAFSERSMSRVGLLVICAIVSIGLAVTIVRSGPRSIPQYDLVSKGDVGGLPPFGSTFLWKGYDGKLCGIEGGKLLCDATERTSIAQEFVLYDAGNGQIAIQSRRTTLFCVVGHESIVCDQSPFSGHPGFKYMISSNGGIALAANVGVRVCALAAGVIRCDRAVVSDATQLFAFERLKDRASVGRVEWKGQRNMCIQVANNENYLGNPVEITACSSIGFTAGVGQQFEFQSLPTGNHMLRWAPEPTRCVVPARGISTNGNWLVLGDCSDVSQHQFMGFIIPKGSGAIQWAFDQSKCVKAQWDRLPSGNSVVMWDCLDKGRGPEFHFQPVR